MGRTHQVICITHLAQIAAFADRHYAVDKRNFGGRTRTRVVAVEGEAGACAEYLARLRALRWQVMEVRLRAELADDAPKLCAPFTELPEAGMGDAAALCESAHLLAEFRAAVLKLPSKAVDESEVS